MSAREHTRSMLRWWLFAGITVVDLAVRRHDKKMAWHYGVSLRSLPLAWARAENVRQSEIYIRPTRDLSWPVVILDDLPVATARGIARKYDALVVHTSPEGGCHLWLSCSTALDAHRRGCAQRFLAQRIGADLGSVSGEHLGRLAGFKNWKRNGVWVNVLDARCRDRPWIPQFVESGVRRMPSGEQRSAVTETDLSPSGQEWGWICGLLETGCDPEDAYRRLVEKARTRRGDDAKRYARRTISRALEHIASPREIHERRGLTSRPS